MDAALRSAFDSFVNLLDPVQVPQKLAAPATKVLPRGPFHAGVFALFAAVKVAAGHLEAVFRVQYDEFLACHVWNLPDCRLGRNLFFGSGFLQEGGSFGEDSAFLAVSIAHCKRMINDIFC